MTDPARSYRDGRYRVVRVLGEGSQATTLEATDAATGKAVALKCFRVRGAKSWKEVELAEREATVLAQLSHPLLPRYVEHFEEGGELFLVTEKIEGESLLSLRKRGVTFSERDVVRLLRDAAAALAYLHGRNPPIIHRDLKPSNVIRRPDGSFAFIDFGAVRDKLKPEGGSTVVGTFGYMAPEQFQGRAMPASDVYAMGTTALTLLTGREPEDLPHRGLAIDVAAALAGTRVSAPLVRALEAMLRPDPDVRAQAVETAIIGLGAPEGRPERDHRRDDHRLLRDERGRARSAGGLWGIFLALVFVGLSVAQIAVFVALRVAVPVLLNLLSIVFGPNLRRAAASARHAGKVAGATLAAARRSLDEEAVPRVRVSASGGPDPRIRVAPGGSPDRPASDAVPDDEAESDAPDPREQVRRR